MKMKTNRINELALMYATNRDEQTLIELFEEIRNENFFKKHVGYTHYQVLQSNGINLDRDDIESEVNLTIMRAADGYNGTTNFLARVNSYFKLRLYQLIRDNSRLKRDGSKAVSIEKHMDTAYDFFIKESVQKNSDAESACIAKDTLQRYLKSANERYAEVIKSLAGGLTPEQATKKLGFENYDTNARKLVSRARADFEKYWNLQNY
jgi:hypothetical protein